MKIKGIIARPMPNYWYNLAACGDDLLRQSLCAEKKPYFMIYVYDEVKNRYRNYLKIAEVSCQSEFGCTLSQLLDEVESNAEISSEKTSFIHWYNKKMPVGLGNCAMNQICHYIEDELNGYKIQLKRNSDFDYTLLKSKRRCTKEHKEKLKALEIEYCDCVREYKKNVNKLNKWSALENRDFLYRTFNEKAKEICPNDLERLNIILDLTYLEHGNKQFCWDTVGYLICERLGSSMDQENIDSNDILIDNSGGDLADVYS